MPAPSMRRAARALPLLAAAAALLALSGCGHSQTCDFSDRPRDDVWMAVVQASR